MIPLARPWIDEAELDAVADVLRSGMLVQGATVARFEAALAARCDRRFAVAVSNGTSALSLAYRALGLRPGDAVAVPALTWPSPANAAAEFGLVVKLADVDRDSWNATSETLRAAGDVKAAVAIDQFGNPLDAITLGVPVIEDAACAIGSVFASGRPCGSLGVMSCLSFHPRKLVTTGEGGAVLTDDETLAETLRALRNHGQAEPGRFVVAAGNARLSEMAAAMGLAQLDKLDAMIARRVAHADAIRGALPKLRFQRAPEGSGSNVQTLGAILPAEVDRNGFFDAMRKRHVQAGILSYDLATLGTLGDVRDAPVAAELVARGVALPLYPTMTHDERMRVIGATNAALDEATT
ncbi:MAG: DegT/DnrJ/EryC1/StrS family aminotransferase [Sandaracinus sp.]|nr:DegT/DnrJ/EryC1/StrS family aminotransferase [Sandaracinus sp.]MCB9633617.1 DegT/DnrJ/EryC1/StrS family aminotransferase [Sandaracinus sp.]